MGVLAAVRLFSGGRSFPDKRDPSLLGGLYTFGQPMVGDKAFATANENTVGNRLFWHVYRKDIVPHAPPESALDYVHLGGEWRAEALNNPWTRERESSQRAEFLRAVFDVLANAGLARTFPGAMPGKYSLDDHMPSNYLDVSRFTVDPSVGYVVPTWRSELVAKLPPLLRNGVREVLRA